jgi:hypothetical protein
MILVRKLNGYLYNKIVASFNTNVDENHHGYRYKDGLNVDINEFNIRN